MKAAREWGGHPPDRVGSLDRRRLILLLRYVVIASAAYLVLTQVETIRDPELWYVAAFAASNVALAVAPDRLFQWRPFGPALLLVDTAMILFGFSWGPGLTQDLLLVYFLILFLTTIGESVASIALGSALIVVLYGYWLWSGAGGVLEPESWIRLPFFFLVGLFATSLTQELRAERRRREVAEEETDQLRLLLELAGKFSETHATRELVNGLGRFVEGVCPELVCRMRAKARSEDPLSGERLFPLRAHGTEFGVLSVRAQGGRDLTARERWLCQMVAHAAAGALYASEQSVAARSAAEMKEQFLAAVSHELRTPLHAILGYADILEISLGADGDSAREMLDRLRVNACRMQDLVEQVLGFAEIRAGYRGALREEFSLRSLIEELAPLTRELLLGKPVVFSWDVDDGADALVTDRRRVRQLLVCLLSNAAKFTEAGQVRLKAIRTGDRLDMSVSDTGGGIAPSDLAIVFEEFRQLDGSPTRRYGGLGLGLTLSREIAALLGGHLSLDSQVGRGTTVRVDLPMRLAEEAVDADSWGPAAARRSSLFHFDATNAA